MPTGICSKQVEGLSIGRIDGGGARLPDRMPLL
jgi:hypothetical protein